MGIKVSPLTTSIAEQRVQLEHPSRDAIWSRAVEIFDCEDLARQWMTTPLPLLDNQTPQQYADSDEPDKQREVLTILARIDYGMYS